MNMMRSVVAVGLVTAALAIGAGGARAASIQNTAGETPQDPFSITTPTTSISGNFSSQVYWDFAWTQTTTGPDGTADAAPLTITATMGDPPPPAYSLLLYDGTGTSLIDSAVFAAIPDSNGLLGASLTESSLADGDYIVGIRGPADPPYTIDFSGEVDPVPEPTSLAILGAGLVALGWRRFRR